MTRHITKHHSTTPFKTSQHTRASSSNNITTHHNTSQDDTSHNVTTHHSMIQQQQQFAARGARPELAHPRSKPRRQSLSGCQSVWIVCLQSVCRPACLSVCVLGAACGVCGSLFVCIFTVEQLTHMVCPHVPHHCFSIYAYGQR